MARKPLEKWIDEALHDASQEGPCTGLALVHMKGENGRMGHEEVTHIKIANSVLDAKKTADMFRSKAETYAQDMSGVHQFAVWAFYNGSNEPTAKQMFMVNVVSEFGGATEQPNETGKTMQNMRHAEMLIQQVYIRQQAMDNHSVRMIETMSGHMTALMRENIEAYAIVKDMMMKQALDGHNREMERLTFERATEERKKWLSFAPPLINRLFGADIFPENAADTALIEAVAINLNPDQIGMLEAVCPPKLWGPLSARLHEAMKKDRELKEASAKLAVYNGPGALDVTGGAE